MALVEGGETFAVHRTYLRPDGLGKAALDPDKMMLGGVSGGSLTGWCRWWCVSMETGLSLASELLGGSHAVWAALSTSGLRGLHLPPEAGKLTIATDGDTAGREAGHALAERAHALGWAVALLPAPDGRDWNDFLTMKGGGA